MQARAAYARGSRCCDKLGLAKVYLILLFYILTILKF